MYARGKCTSVGGEVLCGVANPEVEMDEAFRTPAMIARKVGLEEGDLFAFPAMRSLII